MILIVDSNVVFAGLLRQSTVRRLLIDSPFELYAPETLILEIRKHEREILKRSGLSQQDFAVLFGLLTSSITIVEKESYAAFLADADRIIGRVDKGDVPFLALALSRPNDGIWTENTRHFKVQGRVPVWTTKALLEKGHAR